VADRGARLRRLTRMNAMTESQIIVVATPVFFALIAVELAVGVARSRNGYRLGDALSSIGLGVMSRIVGLFTALLTLGIYVWIHDRFAIAQLPTGSVWTSTLQVASASHSSSN